MGVDKKDVRTVIHRDNRHARPTFRKPAAGAATEATQRQYCSGVRRTARGSSGNRNVKRTARSCWPVSPKA